MHFHRFGVLLFFLLFIEDDAVLHVFFNLFSSLNILPSLGEGVQGKRCKFCVLEGNMSKKHLNL